MCIENAIITKLNYQGNKPKKIKPNNLIDVCWVLFGFLFVGFFFNVGNPCFFLLNVFMVFCVAKAFPAVWEDGCVMCVYP